MKLSLVFELLLIFVLLAFAASKSTRREKNPKKAIQIRNEETKQDDNGINKYCKCSDSYCNCCREFNVPLVNLDGPGCASLMYLLGDRMSVSLSFGNKVITNRTLSGRKPSPVCMPLPGGISKFCGRVYNIARSGEDFRACLGLELQSKSSVEAAIRVSCFKFGPKGVIAEPADPLPLVPQDEEKDEDDDDDDDDDDEDDDDDDDFGLGDDDDDDDEDDDSGLEAANDVDGGDYTGFSLLGDDILGDIFGTSGGKKKNKNKKKQAPTTSTTTTTTTRRPRPTRRSTTKRPFTRTTTTKPVRTTTVRVRPTTRRPNRKPVRRPSRPNRRTTTESTISIYPVTAQDDLHQARPQQSTEHNYISDSTAGEQNLEPVAILTQKPISTVAEATTPKIQSVTNIEDAGLQMSLAHITGQLSEMPVTTIIPTVKESKFENAGSSKDMLKFEKIETMTPRNPSTMAFSSTSEDRDVGSEINDDMVQIVESLDSQSSEHIQTSVEPESDEGRADKEFLYNYYSPSPDKVQGDYYEGLSLPKKKHKKHKKGNSNDDYEDVLGLTSIGESIIHSYRTLSQDGKRKHKDKLGHGRKNKNDDDDILGIQAWTETLGLGNSGNKRNNKGGRRRNKMMRGDWSAA